jgi:NAD(P)-dependent dehydrogenase (short-subunit alcohol dehydrogenase family)
MQRFEGKKILITGGSAGIGLAGARRIVEEGGTVAVTGRDRKRLDELRSVLPPPSLVLRNDAARPAAADELLDSLGDFGPLDGLWLNAGFAEVCALEEVDAAFFDRMMNANVRGPVLHLAKLAPSLGRGASVVVTSSTSSYEGAAMASVYAATKGALLSLARCWATALAPRGIRVNVLVPGAIGTHFRDFMPEDTRETFEGDVVSRTPLGRIGSAEEAAAVALFLLSDDAGYVTGSQYAVDGGLSMH